MHTLKKIMIKKFALLKLKYDFMGYEFESHNELSYHHLIIPHQFSIEKGFGNGMYEWNGAILCKDTSHDYLHIVERYNYDMFCEITSEMLDEVLKGYLDMENIKAINDILTTFERENCSTLTKRGHLVIKEEYTRRLLK